MESGDLPYLLKISWWVENRGLQGTSVLLGPSKKRPGPVAGGGEAEVVVPGIDPSPGQWPQYGWKPGLLGSLGLGMWIY